MNTFHKFLLGYAIIGALFICAGTIGASGRRVGYGEETLIIGYGIFGVASFVVMIEGIRHIINKSD